MIDAAMLQRDTEVSQPTIDPLSGQQRSERMSRVRRTGNKSTEGRVETALLASGIDGWEKHPKDIAGQPDFFFRSHNLALFVDGCFWHACPMCNRRTPATRQEFWREKIEGNRRRDNRTRRKLRKSGFHVMRVWEHELRNDTWLKRLRAMIRRGMRAAVAQA